MTTHRATDHESHHLSTADRAQRLVRRAPGTRGEAGTYTIPAARRLVTGLLARMQQDRMVLIESGTSRRFGPGVAPTDPVEATVEIRDPRAWTALVSEGSIGLGRGYIEGWWHSDDPTAVVRVIIRNLGPVDELRNRLARLVGRAGTEVRRYMPKPTRSRNREDIAAHYDLGNEFFRLFLDDTMTYSSAVYPRPDAELADASRNKYDRILTKLGIDADHRVLEIGTGWGGFATRAAETTGCQVTTTTVSAEQFHAVTELFATSSAADRIRPLKQDWRDLTGQFDRVVSIEMIEAVDWRHYDRFFSTIEDRLTPDGLVGLQAICVPDRRWERVKNTEDFIRRFVFPGGFLPSIGAIARSVSRATSLQLIDVEDFSAHYAETLRRWRERFDDRLDDVAALGLDDRFCRLWRFYLSYCEAGFLERHCTVNQFVLAGARWRPDGLTLRPV